MVVWQKIEYWPYEASSDGQIRRVKTNYILKPRRCPKTNYLRVNLYNGSKKSRKTCSVHVLVCETFHGALVSERKRGQL